MSEQAMRAGSAQLAAHWAANKGLVVQLSTLYSAFPHLFQERDEILTRLSTLDAKSLSVAEVKQAYKKASLRLHPDRVRGRSTAYKLESEEVLKQLTMAHADTSQWFKGLKLDTSSSYYGSGPSSSRTTHARSSSSASASKPLRPGPPRPEPLHKDDCDSMEPPPFMPPGVADFAAQRRREAAHGGGGSGGGNGGGNGDGKGDGKGEADRGAGRPRSRRSHHHRRRASVDGAGCPRMAALEKELEEGMDVSTAAAAAAAVAVEQVVAEQLEKGSIGRAHAAAKVYGKRPERSAARRRARADGAAAEENGSRSGCGSGRGGAIGESSPEESWERVGDHPAQLHGQADCARPFCSRMPGVSREASSSSGVHAQQSGTTDDEVSVAGTSDTDVVVESDGDSGIDIEVDHDEQYDRDNHGPSVEIDAERTHNHQPHDQGLDEFDDFASLQEVRSRLMQADGPNANVAASSPAHLPAKLSTHSRCTQRAQVAGTGCCHSVACGGGDGAASRRLVVRVGSAMPKHTHCTS
uniref:J domain-containing protein n=1 Tax=Chrysotila carterae TaxID=13221 RepID=A0A7S4B8A9_CHRCT